VLGLGRVFTANMTGNVVFLGFAAAGVPGFSIARAVMSLVGFSVGAVLGGRLGVAMAGVARRRWLLSVAVVEAGLCCASVWWAVGALLVSLGGLALPLVVTGACIVLVTVAYAAHPASKMVSSEVHQ